MKRLVTSLLLLAACGDGHDHDHDAATCDLSSTTVRLFLSGRPTPSSNLSVHGTVTSGPDITIVAVNLAVLGPFVDAPVYAFPATVTGIASNQTWSASFTIDDLLAPSNGRGGSVKVGVEAITNCHDAAVTAASDPFAVEPPPDANVDAATPDASVGDAPVD